MKREIRSSLIAGMGGTGAIIDVGSESFVVPGIGSWRQSELRPVELSRLSSRLRKVLKAPKHESPSLQVRRFPRAMFCERCRRMTFWRTEMERRDSEPLCPQESCGGRLVAMRFIVACENGHLDDVNWRFWAHSGRTGRRECRVPDQLSFVVDTAGATGGLSTLRVKCSCGSSRSLEDLTNKTLIKQIFSSCGGQHPWLFGQAENCDADVVVLQRGATNLHYPITISALDIPVEINESAAAEYSEQVRGHARHQKLVDLLKSLEGNSGELIEAYVEMIADSIGCDTSIVLEVASADAEGRALGGSATEVAELDQNVLLDEEWRTLAAALDAGELVSHNFEAKAESLSPSSPEWMKRLLGGVLLVTRLREVRVYRGYQRVRPGGSDKIVLPDVGGNERWLPASEIFGEGIVLTFDYESLQEWSFQIPASERSAFAALEEKRVEENYWFLPPVDPVFIAIHTLSHLLLRRITFECGYSSSSLRERLYISHVQGHAGIMIYTADSDSEGSLGGLVRQGRRDRLSQTLLEGIDQGRWCSSDPVCSETAGQGLGGFNHAACHACCLVSETSCTVANTLLDRRALFDDDWGLLSFLEGR